MIRRSGIRSLHIAGAVQRTACAVLAAVVLAAVPAAAYEKEIDALSVAMAEKIASAGKTTVAVVDFTDLDGGVTELGRFLAEELSAAFAGAGGGFEIVDRTHLKSILREHKLAESGIIDPSTARQLGDIAGVDALVTGTLTPFGDSVRVAAKVLDVSTAKVVSAERVSIAKTQAITELLAGQVRQGAGPGRPAPPPPDSSLPEPSADRQRYVGGKFVYVLEGCRASGSTVVCRMTVTNTGEDKELLIDDNYTRLFDNLGREYRPSQFQLGEKQSSSRVNVRKMMISGIPIAGSVTFQGIAPEATSVAVLQLSVANPHWSTFKFRDIELQR